MFKRIVFNQFHNGKDRDRARIGSLMMVALLFFMAGLVLLLLNVSALGSASGTGLGARTLGRLGGALALGLIYAVVFVVLGSKTRFERYWQEYEALDEYDREALSRSGFWIFTVPLVLLFVWLMWLIL